MARSVDPKPSGPPVKPKPSGRSWLPSLDSIRVCPKCGFGRGTALFGGDTVFSKQYKPYPERIIRGCPQCQFEWSERTFDGERPTESPTVTVEHSDSEWQRLLRVEEAAKARVETMYGPCGCGACERLRAVLEDEEGGDSWSAT